MDQPMPSSPPPVSYPSPSPVPSAPKNRTWVIVLVTVLVLGLGVAGAVWGYLKYSVPPETKILASFEKLSTVKTFAFSAKINASGEIQKKPDLLSFSSFNTLVPFDTVNSLPKEFTQASVEMTMNGKVEENALDVSTNFLAKETDKTFPAFGFDFISKDSSLSFRIPSIPVVMGFDFSDFNNQWVTIDGKKLQEQLSAFIPADVTEKIETLQKEKENAGADVYANLKNTLVQQPPITVTKTYKVETVNGIKLQPYAFVLNQKNLGVIIDKMALYQKDTGVTEQDVTDMKNFLKEVKKFDAMIWMDTQTLMPYKITIAFQFIDAETQKPMDIDIVVDMKDFNKPMNIAIPTDGFTLEQAIQKITEKFMEKSLSELSQSSSMTSSTDMIFSDDFNSFDSTSLPSGSGTQSLDKDTDGDGVKDSLEEFYGTSSTNKDTDGDGYTDKQEIDAGYDPLHPPKK